MKSVRRGKSTSGAEVTNVSTNGLWLLIDQREVFLAFSDFPWFEHATIREIGRVERPNAQHLYWPALDIDLAVDSLHHPEAYPLVSNARRNKPVPGNRQDQRRDRSAGTKPGRVGRPSRG